MKSIAIFFIGLVLAAFLGRSLGYGMAIRDLKKNNRDALQSICPCELYNEQGFSVGRIDSAFVFKPVMVYALPEN